MNEALSDQDSRETSQAYLLFGICFVLVVCVGGLLQSFAMRPGLVATLVLLILTPALVFIRSKGVGIAEGLRLRRVSPSIVCWSGLIGMGTWGLGMLVARALERLGVKTLSQGIDQGLDTGTGFALSLLVVALGPGICEEALFRGTIQGVLERRGRGFAVGVAAALFGLLHVMLGIAIPAALMGACYGWLVMRTGSIVPAMIAHSVNNALAFSFLYFLGGEDPSWLIPSFIVLGMMGVAAVLPLSKDAQQSIKPSPLSRVPAGMPLWGRLGCVLPLLLFTTLTVLGMSALPFVISMEKGSDGDTILYANRDTFLFRTLVKQSESQVVYAEKDELRVGTLVDLQDKIVLVRGGDENEISISIEALRGVVLKR